MFPPPPSPFPLGQAIDTSDMAHRPIEDTHASLSKQRLYSSIRWTVVLVPLTLTLLAAVTRFWAHPAVFDLLSANGDHEWTRISDWGAFHGPHGAASNRLPKRSSSKHLVARNNSSPVPTVPVDPTLPTPFPQPFDTTLSANFSTTSCYDFFLNMTETDAFLSCRPFSLLVSTSYAFSQAQRDIDLMNTDVWGTCNTDPSQEDCDSNMAWFASTLQSSCQIDIANQIETAVLTLNALFAYDLMRNAACQVDPTTNSYCYVEAVANSDSSSFFFYQLPLGQALGPNTTTNVCEECTSGLMESYGTALNGSGGANLKGLAETYNSAVDTFNSLCGTSYTKVTPVSIANSAGASREASLAAMSLLAVVIAEML